MHQFIFNHASDVIVYSDIEGKILSINQRASDLFGVSPHEMINTSLVAMPFFCDFDNKRLTRHLREIVTTKTPSMIELQVTKAGYLKTVEINSSPVHKGNAFQGIISIVRDVSERRRKEEISRKNEENFKIFFENANDGIVYLDKNAVIWASNKKIEELFGYTREEVIGKQFMDFAIFSPVNMKSTYEIFLESIEGKLPPLLEFEGYHKNGQRFYLEINPTLIKEHDEIVGLVAIIRDTTSRKRAEEEHIRLIDIIEATPDIVITYDAYGNISYVNKAGRNVFDLSGGDDYTKSSLPSIREVLPVLASKGIWQGETSIVSKDRKPIEVSQVIMSHCGSERNKLYFSTIMRDITDQKQNENHIKYLTHHLIRIQEDERARIARDLHDNLAQDLSTLKILCETLYDFNSDVPPYIQKKITEMSSIFKQTIASVRDITYNLRPASLHELGLVNTLYQFCDEFQNNQRLVSFYTAGMQKIKLDFDTEINLYRIAQEAFNNIKKHAQASSIKVNLTASFPTIILQIEDNGKGFELHKRKKEIIYEKRMGLKSIEERVGLLNGTFRIQSRISVGTIIHVEVPYSPDWHTM